MLKDNILNVAVVLTEDFTIFDCNTFAERLCIDFEAIEIDSGFFIPAGERDITFKFDDWYDRNMAAMSIKEERLVDRQFTLTYGEEE